MIPSINKSLTEVLHERASSPFFGTLIISWCIWNWKIIYLTIVVDQDLILPLTKIEYIQCYYSDPVVLAILPFTSTILLIGVVPWLVQASLWVFLKFEGKRRALWENAEKERMISAELYSKLREENNDSSESFKKILTIRDEEISVLRGQMNEQNELKNREYNDPKILYAEYRTKNKREDVTQSIIPLSNAARFQANNENFGEIDPGSAKELFILFRFRGDIHKLTVPEHSVIERTSDFGFSLQPIRLGHS
jgi:hypothetical protein